MSRQNIKDALNLLEEELTSIGNRGNNMKHEQLESREEIMKIIKEEEWLDQARHPVQSAPFMPKFKLGSFLEDHPLVCMYAMVPIISTITSWLVG